jgi:hypothetical protein
VDFVYQRKVAPKNDPQPISAAAAIQQTQAVSSSTTGSSTSTSSISNSPQYLIHSPVEALK